MLSPNAVCVSADSVSHFELRGLTGGVGQVKEFADLLEQIFIIDPAKRITVPEALKHPFIQN